MIEAHQDFAFMDGDRKFTCRVETSRRSPAEAWWWFHVSTEGEQRHAPFRAADTDTRREVQARVVAYYDHLLARRAEPPQQRWARRATPAPAPAAEPAPAV